MPKIVTPEEYRQRDLKKLDGSLDTFMSRLLREYSGKGLSREEVQARLNARWETIINHFNY